MNSSHISTIYYTNKSQRELDLKCVEKMAVKLFNQFKRSSKWTVRDKLLRTLNLNLADYRKIPKIGDLRREYFYDNFGIRIFPN